MDWLEDAGALYMAVPHAPALALDMALYGPAHRFSYDLAASMIATQAPIELYPPEGAPLEGLG